MSTIAVAPLDHEDLRAPVVVHVNKTPSYSAKFTPVTIRGGAAPPNDAYPSEVAYSYESFNSSVVRNLVTNGPTNSQSWFWNVTYIPLTNEIYVGSVYSPYVVVFNATTGKGVSAIDLGEGQPPASPQAFAYDSKDRVVFAADGSQNKVSVIDPIRHTVISTIGLSTAPLSIIWDSNNNEIYVGDWAGVSILNASSHAFIANVSTCGQVSSMVLDPARPWLYLSDAYCTNDVLALNTSSNDLVPSSVFGASVGPSSSEADAMFCDRHTGFLLVGMDDSAVYFVNLTTGRMDGNLSIIGAGEGLAYDSQDELVWTSSVNMTGSYLTAINATTNKLMSQRMPVGNSPDGVTYDPRDRLIYVSDYFGVNLTSFYSNPFSSKDRNIAGFTNFMRISYDNLTDSLFAAAPDPDFACQGAGTITVLNGGSPVPTFRGFFQAGLGAQAVTLTGAGKIGLVENGCSRVVDRFGTTSLTPLAPFGVPNGTASGAFDPSNGAYYLSIPTSNKVAVLNGTTGNLSTTLLSVGIAPEGVTWDPFDDRVFVANQGQGTISVIDPRNNTVVANISVGSAPIATVVDPSSGMLYVANSGSNNVSMINGTTLGVEPTSLAAGSAPVSLAVDVVDDLLYVADGQSNSVRVIDLKSGSILDASIPVGLNPQGVTWDSKTDAIFVSCFNGGVINVIARLPTIETFSVTPAVLAVGQAFAATTIASSAIGNLAYSYTGLPGTCTSYSDSNISCIADVIGGSRIIVTVRDQLGWTATTSAAIQIVPSLDLADLVITPDRIEVGWSYSVHWNTSGGQSPYALSINNTPGPCKGVSLGHAVCRATTSGVFLISATTSDSIGEVRVAFGALEVFPSLRVASFSAYPGSVPAGTEFIMSASLTGGAGWTTERYFGLPSSCASSNTTALTCIPSTPGKYNVTFTASDSLGAISSANISFTVSPNGVGADIFLIVSPQRIALADPVLFAIEWENASTLNVTFKYLNLPPGCVSKSNLTLTCTPTVAGVYGVSVEGSPQYGPNITSGPIRLEVDSLPNSTSSACGVSCFIVLVTVAAVGGATVTLLALTTFRRSRKNRE